MNKLYIAMLLDSAISLEKRIDELQEDQYWNEIKDFIIQALHQPTLDELRDEIIKELNEYYDVEYEYEDSSYQYVENDNYCLFFYDMELPEFRYQKVDKEINFDNYIGVKLAHKITTYFIRLGETK